MIVESRPQAERTLDPITIEVIGNALSSIVEEMGETLIRAAYSTNIKERRDASTALFDANGLTLAQAEHIPIHLGSLIGIVEEVLRRYPLEDIREGDAFIGNDAYTGGGTHLPDIVILEPIFFEGKLVAWASNLAHHADFVDRGHAHIYQEGLRIPPVRLYRAGTLNVDVQELILLNCQVPRERLNDLRAQIASNRLGVARFKSLCAKYGRELVLEAANALLDYAERKMRAGIAAIPDGNYIFEDRFDSEELGEEELILRVAVEVRGDEMSLDFDGNPQQVRAGLNMVWTALLATVYYAVKTVVDPEILPNAGLYRPIHVTAPLGTIVNSSSPAAVNGRVQTCQRVVDLIHGALAQAVPERLIGACNGANVSCTFSGINPRTGEYYVYLETIGGGFGARATKDGLDGVQVHVTNTSNLPVECLEPEHPLLVEAYELVNDSCGPGKWRGGMGIHRRIRVLDHEAALYLNGTRKFSSPWGLFGGGEGGRFSYDLTEGARPLKRGLTFLRSGEAVSVYTPGAGGYGPPNERDPELVRRDLREEKTSAEYARIHYGGIER
jgi:N-methylhydantoinase B